MTDPAAARREELLEALLRETTIEYEGGAAWHEGGDPARALLAAFEAEVLEGAADLVKEKAVDEAINVATIDALNLDNPQGKRFAGVMGNRLLVISGLLRTRAAALRKGAE